MTVLKSSSLSIFYALSVSTTLASPKHSELLHQFVCIDNGNNILIHINQFKEGESWSTKLPKGARDIQLVDENSLLISHRTGATEYDLTSGKERSWKVSGYKDIQSALRLPNGNTALLSRRGTIHIVNPQGEKVSTTNIQKKGLDLRLLRLNNQGQWTIGAKSPKAILIVDTEGSIIKEIPIPGKSYKVEQLPNGNYLSSTGDTCKVVEVNPQTSNIVHFAGGKEEHPEAKLDFCSGWTLLANQHIIMTNWLGHNKHGTSEHLFEFSPDNTIIWSWGDHKLAQQITNVLVIR